ncbi:MAG: tetratricopeptide repeat protein [Bacteroidales bacterium]|jgi:tetratricopeptide (TPR) repeat protein|nr:tetratricopeptide repeat protein [Bacteroidales bacterium]
MKITFYKILITLSVLFAAVPEQVFSQSRKNDIGKADELFEEKLYIQASAIYGKTFEKAENTDSDIAEYAKGMKIICDILSGRKEAAGEASDYIVEYPTSSLTGKIKFGLASGFFREGKYKRAYDYLKKTEMREISVKQRNEYMFYKAYCEFKFGEPDKAAEGFRYVAGNSDPDGTYLNPSVYYLGYIDYLNGNFKRAIRRFSEIKSDDRFSVMSEYYILESNFRLKNYNYVISGGDTLLNGVNDDLNPKIANLISQSYYNTGHPDKAKYYFELYYLAKGSLTRNDFYYSGMLAYSLSQYLSAIDNFKKVTGTRDSLGQIAYYHMAECYIRLKNKVSAKDAFKNAYLLNFDPKIKEDALFNYSKLAFDLNRDVAPFNEYLNDYATSFGNKDEIYRYMSESYIANREYSEAIKALRNVAHPNSGTNSALQKALFLRGMQLVQSGAYGDASAFFEQSSRYEKYNGGLANLSKYWLAECKFRHEDYGTSISILKELQRKINFKISPEYPVSFYNLGYSYFNMGDYDSAIKEFERYINYPADFHKHKSEASERIADCFFREKKYDAAADRYSGIAKESGYDNLYSALGGALAYGFSGNDTLKTELLEHASDIKNSGSPMYARVLFELGRTYEKRLMDKQALATFEKIVGNPADSSYRYKAYLEMGLIYSNEKNYEKAISCYKGVIAEKPESEESNSALSSLESLYAILNKSDEFLKYLDGMNMSRVKTPSEKEDIIFNSAEQQFLGENYAAALSALGRYLSAYPDGNKYPQALFYEAECYKALGKKEKAADTYMKVMKTGEGSFNELSTLNYADISYGLKRYAKAAEGYQTLEAIAKISNNRIVAKLGCARCFYYMKKYEDCIDKADELMTGDSTDAATMNEAEYYKAKSLLASGNREKANILLRKISSDKTGEFHSEASYLLVLDAYDSGNFTSAETQTFNFSDTDALDPYWLAKCFIVLGDCYAEQGNWQQARATFKSIADNYNSTKVKEIKALAESRISRLDKMKK